MIASIDKTGGIESVAGIHIETSIVESLRRGDEDTFVRLVDEHHTSMIRVALVYTSDRAVAEEATQETWLGVLQGVNKFDGRCSLKTWIYSILTNCAKTRGHREGRSMAFSSVGHLGEGYYEPAVDPERFRKTDPWKDHWSSFPQSWDETPEDCVLTKETRLYIDKAIETLPPTQKEVITLRDIAGCTAEETCNIIGVSETNQRVLLHRARSKVRGVLELYLSGDEV